MDEENRSSHLISSVENYQKGSKRIQKGNWSLAIPTASSKSIHIYSADTNFSLSHNTSQFEKSLPPHHNFTLFTRYSTPAILLVEWPPLAIEWNLCTCPKACKVLLANADRGLTTGQPPVTSGLRVWAGDTIQYSMHPLQKSDCIHFPAAGPTSTIVWVRVTVHFKTERSPWVYGHIWHPLHHYKDTQQMSSKELQDQNYHKMRACFKHVSSDGIIVAHQKPTTCNKSWS